MTTLCAWWATLGYLKSQTVRTICPAIVASMSNKGNCYDNAFVETFFKSLKAGRI